MCTLDRNPGHTFHINGFIYSVGEARVFLAIAGGGGDKQGGVGTLLTCPSVKGETPHFFHPWSQKDLWGYFKDLSN